MRLPREVTDILEAWVSGVGAALGDNLVGVYLRGSLAMGDFDPLTSDLDFFVVTERRVSAAEFAALTAVHAQLTQRPNRFADQFEGPYINRAAARCFRLGGCHPTIARGEALTWREHGANWVLERWMVRERGITLLGPSPPTLIDAVSPDELRAAVRRRLHDWADWVNQPDDPEWRLPRNHKAYVVETMCRALYTLTCGELASKPRAVAWALATLPDPWHATVERSLTWRTDSTLDPAIDPELGRFVLWAASQGEA